MSFSNSTNPFLLISKEEEALLRPSTIEELDALMTELEAQTYPRVEVCIPSLIYQEPTAIPSPPPSTKPTQTLKRKEPNPETPRPKRLRTQPQSQPSSGKRGIPIPKSWEAASSEDLLIFKLKENGGTWTEITEEWNEISGLGYSASTVSNRWRKIVASLGNPPEKMWDLDERERKSLSAGGKDVADIKNEVFDE
ncbi:hypothetical protein PENDEC_c023G00829 [Penicillium decumbens]|uniref:Myb-like domain-containing protein n=1 Tax=Penicillium decumbens TaxID=69771 RepID=A0A1V6P0H6_PENDC|nr:hypothetical protein PENDEC_c023G00829 [Penicillium decumbens]